MIGACSRPSDLSSMASIRLFLSFGKDQKTTRTMTANNTTKTIERLASRLEELESQLELDLDETASQFEEHCQHLRQAYHSFPDHLAKLKEDLGIEWHDLKVQLDELEVQLALARMETMEAFQERRKRIIKALNAMEDTMRKIESAEDNEGLVPYKNLVGRARKLEDKIAALEVHFKLSDNHTGTTLDREKDRVFLASPLLTRESIRKFSRCSASSSGT